MEQIRGDLQRKKVNSYPELAAERCSSQLIYPEHKQQAYVSKAIFLGKFLEKLMDQPPSKGLLGSLK